MSLTLGEELHRLAVHDRGRGVEVAIGAGGEPHLGPFGSAQIARGPLFGAGGKARIGWIQIRDGKIADDRRRLRLRRGGIPEAQPGEAEREPPGRDQPEDQQRDEAEG